MLHEDIKYARKGGHPKPKVYTPKGLLLRLGRANRLTFSYYFQESPPRVGDGGGGRRILQASQTPAPSGTGMKIPWGNPLTLINGAGQLKNIV